MKNSFQYLVKKEFQDLGDKFTDKHIKIKIKNFDFNLRMFSKLLSDKIKDYQDELTVERNIRIVHKGKESTIKILKRTADSLNLFEPYHDLTSEEESKLRFIMESYIKIRHSNEIVTSIKKVPDHNYSGPAIIIQIERDLYEVVVDDTISIHNIFTNYDNNIIIIRKKKAYAGAGMIGPIGLMGPIIGVTGAQGIPKGLKDYNE